MPYKPNNGYKDDFGYYLYTQRKRIREKLDRMGRRIDARKEARGNESLVATEETWIVRSLVVGDTVPWGARSGGLLGHSQTMPMKGQP